MVCLGPYPKREKLLPNGPHNEAVFLINNVTGLGEEGWGMEHVWKGGSLSPRNSSSHRRLKGLDWNAARVVVAQSFEADRS